MNERCRDALHRPRRDPHRGAARRAGRCLREAAPPARRHSRAAAPARRRLPFRDGDEPGRARHRVLPDGHASRVRSSCCCRCSSRKASPSTKSWSARTAPATAATAASPRRGWSTATWHASRSTARAAASSATARPTSSSRRASASKDCRFAPRDVGCLAAARGRADCARGAPRSRRAPHAGDRHRRRRRPRRDRAGHDRDRASASSTTCSNRSRATAASRRSLALPGRPARRRAPHGRGLRARPRRGAAPGAGRQARHRPLRIRAADGRVRGAGRARPLRPRVLRVLRPVHPRPRSAGCRPSSCRISSVRWPTRSAPTIHVEVRGENAHHMVEACFKALGRALRQAIRVEGDALPSTKGIL